MNLTVDIWALRVPDRRSIPSYNIISAWKFNGKGRGQKLNFYLSCSGRGLVVWIIYWTGDISCGLVLSERMKGNSLRTRMESLLNFWRSWWWRRLDIRKHYLCGYEKQRRKQRRKQRWPWFHTHTYDWLRCFPCALLVSRSPAYPYKEKDL